MLSKDKEENIHCAVANQKSKIDIESDLMRSKKDNEKTCILSSIYCSF